MKFSLPQGLYADSRHIIYMYRYLSRSWLAGLCSWVFIRSVRSSVKKTTVFAARSVSTSTRVCQICFCEAYTLKTLLKGSVYYSRYWKECFYILPKRKRIRARQQLIKIFYDAFFRRVIKLKAELLKGKGKGKIYEKENQVDNHKLEGADWTITRRQFFYEFWVYSRPITQ